MSERSQAPQTTTVAFRRARASVVPPATDVGTDVQRRPSTMPMSRTSFFRGDADGGGSPAEFANLLGIGGQECDAARIIMAAQVRLRLLRQSQPPRHVRDRAQQIMQARDVLLRSAVEATHVPVACPR